MALSWGGLSDRVTRWHQLAHPTAWAGIAPLQTDATLSLSANCSRQCGLTWGKNLGLSGVQHDICRKGRDKGLGGAQNGSKASSQAEFSLGT